MWEPPPSAWLLLHFPCVVWIFTGLCHPGIHCVWAWNPLPFGADPWACMAFVKSPYTQGVAEWSTGWVWGSGSRCRLNPGLSLTCYTLLGKSSNFSASVFSGVKWGYRLPHGITAGINWDELGGSDGKEPACDAGDPCSIPGLGRSPGDGNVYSLQHSCWRIPSTGEPGELQSMGSERVRHDWVTNTQYHLRALNTGIVQ